MKETAQLLKLRSLRVQRARERRVQAQEAVERAEQAVLAREQDIERGKQALAALARHVVHTLAPRLPRWVGVADAERERLADRLERDEYGLIDDENALEQAQEALQQARAELSRALAREDAVRGLVQDQRRAAERVREQRVELEIEDRAAGTRP
jgi:hypothetical protein